MDPICVKGIYLAAAPVLASGDTSPLRIDSDGILLVKSVGGGGTAYAQGLTHPVSAAQQLTILNTLPIARYNAAGFTLADTQGTELQVDSTGRLLVSDASVGHASYTSAGDATSGSVVASASRKLRQINGYNASASTRYFQLFDSVANPADGTVPFWTSLEIPPNSNFSMTFADGLLFPTNGIRWVSSSTRTTKTITGVADMNVSALYD